MKRILISLLLLATAGVAATVHSDFEGGSVDKVEKVSDTQFRISVKGETDQAGRNRQASWYYFRVDAAPREAMIFDMVGLPGEYNFQPNQGAITDKTPPVISYDRKTWTHLTSVEYDAKEPRLRLRVEPKGSTFWIAHTPPYTLANLETLRAEVRRHPDAKESVIGKSVQGRDLYLWTIGKGSPAKTVWLMFRQHSWESGSSWVGEGAIRLLLSKQELRTQFLWKIFPICDPDGVAQGGVRFNRNGYDLNRNWDVEDPKLMPEITAERNAIASWIRSGKTIDLFFSLHNTETTEYLEAAPGGDAKPQFRQLAERFFAQLTQNSMFDASRPLFYSTATTTAGMKGRMNVIQGLDRDFAIPGFLMENRIAFHPKLSHFPEVDDRLNFGRQLIAAIVEALR